MITERLETKTEPGGCRSAAMVSYSVKLESDSQQVCFHLIISEFKSGTDEYLKKTNNLQKHIHRTFSKEQDESLYFPKRQNIIIVK